MTLIAGVDGCRGGWVAVLVDHQLAEARHWQVKIYSRLDQMFAEHPDLKIVGIDMPIGLYESVQRRSCDVEARKLLGWPRASSVFAAPARSHLLMDKYSSGLGITVQTFNIQPKVKEVDDLVDPEVQLRLFEVHPEVSFYALAGGIALTSKKSRIEGRVERIGLLKNHFPDIAEQIKEAELFNKSASLPRVKPDDIIDAFAVAWTAMRISVGRAHCLGGKERDARGLLMQIWY